MTITTKASTATKFKYECLTTIPKEIGKGWVDRSWHNDASACAWLDVPSAKTPKAVLVLWVQPDNKAEWELPDQPRFQLDFLVDGDEGWDDRTSKTLLKTDDIKAVVAEVLKYARADR